MGLHRKKGREVQISGNYLLLEPASFVNERVE